MRELALTLAALAAAAALIALDRGHDHPFRPAGPAAAKRPLPEGERGRPAARPGRGAVRRAQRYARGREGLVSFASVDSRGRVRGLRMDRRYGAASVVKALLLAAELRRLEGEDAALDATTGELLRRMITYSDNDAADAIYARVGDPGLNEVATRGEMEAFEVSGHWGNATITARDIARFMWRLNDALPGGKRRFGRSLLAAVVPEQRWGIPEAASSKWRVWFKGGWREGEVGQLVHQAAALRHEDGARVALAVLTDAQPSHEYGTETVRGIAGRLFRPRGS